MENSGSGQAKVERQSQINEVLAKATRGATRLEEIVERLAVRLESVLTTATPTVTSEKVKEDHVEYVALAAEIDATAGRHERSADLIENILSRLEL